jgi:hypothetical protein
VRVRVFVDAFYAPARPDFHAHGAGFGQEAIHDGLRIVGNGKHAAVGLGFEAHAPPLEPLHGGGGVELGERTGQAFFAPRVALYQAAPFVTGVGDVAAAPARNLYFRKQFIALFEDDDAAAGKARAAVTAPKKPAAPPPITTICFVLFIRVAHNSLGLPAPARLAVCREWGILARSWSLVHWSIVSGGS